MEYKKELLDHFTIEQLNLFSENQLNILTIEDLKSLIRIKLDEKKEILRIEKFWTDEYINMSIRDKAKYWAGAMFKSMRLQEESGLNIYAIYNKHWLHNVLEKEPDFVRLLPEIYNVWGGMFDASKVDAIIKSY